MLVLEKEAMPEEQQSTVIVKPYTTGWNNAWSDFIPKTPEDVEEGWINLIVFPHALMPTVNKDLITTLANNDAEFLYQWEFREDGCYDVETGVPLFRIVDFTELVMIFAEQRYVHHRIFIHPQAADLITAMSALCGSVNDTLRHFYTPKTAPDVDTIAQDITYQRDVEII